MNEHLNSFYQKAREHNDIANDLFRKYDIKKGLRMKMAPEYVSV